MAEQVLTLTCPQCKRAFRSTIQLDRDDWAPIRMDLVIIERCPWCEGSSSFSKSDYFFESS
jgi:hypothetical protein